MELDTEMKDEINKHYYLPHLCVIKESSISTKLRVVFNGSSKSSKGISLNDKYITDITKMYRQILVHPKDQEYQKILCIENSSQVTKRYILSTISKLFDPLGLVSPVVTTAKLIMQRLWELQVSWDEPVNTEILSAWTNFKETIHSIHNIQTIRPIRSRESRRHECKINNAKTLGITSIVG
ncbi:Pao retrotransposon peptidase [Popillia japonica]|uniref:Pao retrotransposon peptidase n=1 Tax=Popillia japonica TaxID=7064 RepID=A0AAW1N2Z5_POPJA